MPLRIRIRYVYDKGVANLKLRPLIYIIKSKIDATLGLFHSYIYICMCINYHNNINYIEL